MTSALPEGSSGAAPDDPMGMPVLAGAPAVQPQVLPCGGWLPIVVELSEPVRDVPTRGAAVLRVMALWEGQPLGHRAIPAVLDPYPGPLLAETLVHAFAHQLLHHRVGQLLAPPRAGTAVPPVGTVVICTRNRPASLERCLESLAGLEPREGLEVLVVDNGDGDDEVKTQVERRGFRWVHEPVPGLNRARNRGLLEATGDVVVFADDDVVVFPSWAGTLLDCFDDPLVGAAAGLVLPAVLDSEHQRVLETHFGFSRGHHRRVLDGATDSPLSAGALGAGASMAFRRALMLDLGGFPEALDGGMPTKSGGDTYGLYRVLRAGHRGVYEPRALSLHWHRDGEDELVRTVKGYSTGTYSFLLEALIQDRDWLALPAMAAWTRSWVIGRLVSAALRRRTAPPLSLAVADVIGGLQAPGALLRAHRKVRERGQLALPPGTAGGGPVRKVRPPVEPISVREFPATVSVVIPSRGRRESVLGLVRALDRQESAPSEVVVVVDGDVDGTAAALAALRVSTPVRTVVHEVNQGAAVARNSGAAAATGDVLLFLDDDVLPQDHSLTVAHLAAHRSRPSEVAVAGPCVPAPVHDERPMTLSVRNWWVDHVSRLTTAETLTFTDLNTGNFSMGRPAFAATGGFHRMPRREDWEFSYRVQRSGIDIVAAPSAAIVHPTDHDVRNMLRDRMGEGAGDFVFAETHPEVAHLLPLWSWFWRGRKMQALLSGIFLAPEVGVRALEPLTVAVAAMNQAGARRALARHLDKAYGIAYFTGVAQAATSEAYFLETLSRSPAWPSSTVPAAVPYGLDTGAWNAPDPATVTLDVTVRGRRLATVPSRLGGFPWSAETFGRRLATLPRESMGGHVTGAAS
jgi:glycosyltransferase involved in cell wall biosynthesis